LIPFFCIRLLRAQASIGLLHEDNARGFSLTDKAISFDRTIRNH
jgi:hypothetical protein